MKVIIAGAGQAGTELAKKLTLDNHDVVVIEKDNQKAYDILNQLDVMVVEDTGERVPNLLEAGIKDADVFIAVTDNDELNIMFCMIAKKLANVKTVARVRNPEYSSSWMMIPSEELGIDIMIDPEKLIALEMARLIKSPEASDVEYFAEGKIVFMALKVEKDSEVAGKPINSLQLPPESLIVAISRENGEIIIPMGQDIIEPNDVIYVTKKSGTLTEYGSLVKDQSQKVRDVMILGGGKVGLRLAKTLENSKKNGIVVKLIEKSTERCRVISEQLNKTLVLNGDGTDIKFLQQEGISNCDVVVSVTGNDEINILTSLLAKKLGAKRTIVEINKPDYDIIMQTLGIDCYLSSRLIMANRLAKLFRKSDIITESLLKDGKAEMLELIVSEKSPFANRQLKELRLSQKGIIVAGILRQGKAIIPNGDDVILGHDHLIIFTDPKKVKQVEQFFCDTKRDMKEIV